MKIVVAPDSFKGSLSAPGVAAALSKGLRRVWPAALVKEVPLADGGEGTVQSLVAATGGEIRRLRVTGPLSQPVDAFYGLLGNGRTAVIEMAAASGLPLVPPKRRDPRMTTTRGTGELILDALQHGCDEIIIGIGGSATNDGGAGMAQALGVSFKDGEGNELPPGGASLSRLHTIDISGIDTRLAECRVVAACDVDNPLCGPRGASAVYGPQKGANSQMVEELDGALCRYADVVRNRLGVDVKDMPGAGAAGGLGAGLVAFLNAQLRSGIDIVIDAVKLARELEGASVVITGEGAVDRQTAFGKAPSGVLKAASPMGIPVILVGGSVDNEASDLYAHGFSAIVSSTPRPMPLDEALEQAENSLVDTGETIARLLQVGLAMAD